jgi:negative regulator of sigma E activity
MNCDREQISALMDGELTPAQAAAVLASADDVQPARAGTCTT